MKLLTKRSRLPLALLAATVALAACNDKGRPAYALTSTNTIIKFETTTPATIESEATVTGLGTGESLIQIDFRPNDQTLYGITLITTNGTIAPGYVVSIDPASGALARVDSAATFTTPSQLVAPVVMDINPVGDYLRIIDYAGSKGTTNNCQLPFSTLASSTAAAPPACTNDVATTSGTTGLYYNDNDTNSGQLPQLAAIAHSNDVSGASATTLYGLDITTQSLVTIAGNQLKTVGNCGHAFIANNTGFDIVPDSDQGFAALGSAGVNATFYKVNLTDCNLDPVDVIGGGRQILSLAVTLTDPKDSDN